MAEPFGATEICAATFRAEAASKLRLASAVNDIAAIRVFIKLFCNDNIISRRKTSPSSRPTPSFARLRAGPAWGTGKARLLFANQLQSGGHCGKVIRLVGRLGTKGLAAVQQGAKAAGLS